MLTVQITFHSFWFKYRKSGCEKGIHLKPVHPDQCIKENDGDDDDDDDAAPAVVNEAAIQEPNDPTYLSGRHGRKEENIPVTWTSKDSSKDVNDLKDDEEDLDMNDSDGNQESDKNEMKKRIKSDTNMEGESERENDEDEDDGEDDWDEKKSMGGRKDQSKDSNPDSFRSSESVSCSPTNYDLMKEQIQVKCK